MSDRIRPSDLPYAGSVPSGVGLCKDVNGNLLWDSGSSISQASGGAGVLAAQNTIAILGDSFDERAEVSTVSPFSINSSAIWNCTNMLMMCRLNFVYIDGVSGSGALTTGSRYNTRIAAAIASGAKWLALRASINDISADNTAAALIAEYTALFEQANSAGLRVISNTITPSTAVLTTASRRSAWSKFNQWMLNTAPQLFDIVVIPEHYQLADKSVLTGASNSAYMSDGTHPDAVGAMILAETARDVLDPYFPAKHPLFSISAIGTADWTAADPNPINVGTQVATGTGISGNVATSMGLSVTAGGAVVGSKVTRTDGPGEWQQIVFTGSAANQLAEYYTSPGTSALNAELAIGDIVSLAMEFEIDAATAATDCPIPTLRLIFNGASQEAQGFGFNSLNATPGRTGWRGLVETPRVAIPAGTTSLTLKYRFQNKTTVASTIRIGQHGLINWSRLAA
jgi:hypothetical protein